MPRRREESTNLPAITWQVVGGLMFVEFIALAAIAGVIFLALSAASPNHNDIADSVRRELDGQVAGWNRGDLPRFLESYWADDRLTFYSGGDVTTGWNQTRDRYEKRYRGEGKEMGKLTFESPEVVVISPNDALARGRYTVVFTKGEPQVGLYSVLMRKVGGKWRIVHDHTSTADPPKPAKKSE